jgi:hypothetical protein
MFKVLMATAVLAIAVSSCDVRTKDKIDASSGELKAQDANTATPTTVQLIDSVHDFGNIVEGENVEFSYRFKNVGNYPLVVSNVSASCGCTVPEKPEEPIKPGETGFIKVKFNSEGRPGSAHKTVTVLSNASPTFPELLLKGEVTAKAK